MLANLQAGSGDAVALNWRPVDIESCRRWPAVIVFVALLGMVAAPAPAQTSCPASDDPESIAYDFPRRDGNDEAMLAPARKALEAVAPAQLDAPPGCIRQRMTSVGQDFVITGEDSDPIPRRVYREGDTTPRFFVLRLERPDVPNLFGLVSNAADGRYLIIRFYSGIPNAADLRPAIQELVATGKWLIGYTPATQSFQHWVSPGRPVPRPGPWQADNEPVLVSGEAEVLWTATITGIVHRPSGFQCPWVLPRSRIRLWSVASTEARVNCRYSITADGRTDAVSLSLERAPGADVKQEIEYFRQTARSTGGFEVERPSSLRPLPRAVETYFMRRGRTVYGALALPAGDWMAIGQTIHYAESESARDLSRGAAELMQSVSDFFRRRPASRRGD